MTNLCSIHSHGYITQNKYRSNSFQANNSSNSATAAPAQATDGVTLSAQPVFLSLGKQIARLPIDGTPLEVGRNDKSPLRFRSITVSRKHAMLRSNEGRLEVMDLGSSNGTFLGDEKLAPKKWHSVDANKKLSFAGEVVNWQ